jgi:hypothetical protein
MQTFEGLDYDVVENEAYVQEMEQMTKQERRAFELAKWGITGLIGFCTGFTAFLLRVGVENLADLRFRSTQVSRRAGVPAHRSPVVSSANCLCGTCSCQ